MVMMVVFVSKKNKWRCGGYCEWFFIKLSEVRWEVVCSFCCFVFFCFLQQVPFSSFVLNLEVLLEISTVFYFVFPPSEWNFLEGKCVGLGQIDMLIFPFLMQDLHPLFLWNFILLLDRFLALFVQNFDLFLDRFDRIWSSIAVACFWQVVGSIQYGLFWSMIWTDMQSLNVEFED